MIVVSDFVLLERILCCNDLSVNARSFEREITEIDKHSFVKFILIRLRCDREA